MKNFIKKKSARWTFVALKLSEQPKLTAVIPGLVYRDYPLAVVISLKNNQSFIRLKSELFYASGEHLVQDLVRNNPNNQASRLLIAAVEHSDERTIYAKYSDQTKLRFGPVKVEQGGFDLQEYLEQIIKQPRGN